MNGGRYYEAGAAATAAAATSADASGAPVEEAEYTYQDGYYSNGDAAFL
jgi:hypothetical protein